MDKQEYLNEISSDIGHLQSSNNKTFLSSKIFLISIIGIAGFILIAITGAIIGGSTISLKDRIATLILHIDNTTEIIEKYQSNLKSSDLRSYSSSLRGIFQNTSRNLTEYSSSKYNFKPKEIKKSIQEEETSVKDALDSDLFKAKINGRLDRIYADKMAYEISFVLSHENQILKNASDSSLKDIVTTSRESLSVLYDNFNNFSDN